MEIIKHKLLGIVDNESEIVYNENPFVRKINSDNSVKYFNGLWMKVWTSGKTQLQTLKVSDSYTLSYVRGQKDIETGEDASLILNRVFSGDIDDDGYMGFRYPDVYIEQIREAMGDGDAEILANSVTYAKENNDNTITLKAQNPQTGEWESHSGPMYSETGQTTHINYEIYKIVPPKQGYINVFTTLENTEGKKVLVHDNCFTFDKPTAKSAVTKVVFSKEVDEIPVFAFGMLASLQEVALPDKLKKIPINAFTNCYRLYNVTIPSTVEYVGKYSFNQCFSLSSITLPGNVTYIGDDCFYGCSGLTDIYFDGYKDNCPYGSPWGATNAVIRFKDGYLQGGKLVLTNGIEGDSGQTVDTLYRVEMFDQTVDGVKYYAFSTGEPLLLGESGITRTILNYDYDTHTNYEKIGNYMMALSEFKNNETSMRLFYVKDAGIQGETNLTLYYGILSYDDNDINDTFYELSFSGDSNVAYTNITGTFQSLPQDGYLVKEGASWNYINSFVSGNTLYKYYSAFNQEFDGVIYHAYAPSCNYSWDGKVVNLNNLKAFQKAIYGEGSEDDIELIFIKNTTKGVHYASKTYEGYISILSDSYSINIDDDSLVQHTELLAENMLFVDDYVSTISDDSIKWYYHPLFNRDEDGVTWYAYLKTPLLDVELNAIGLDAELLKMLIGDSTDAVNENEINFRYYSAGTYGFYEHTIFCDGMWSVETDLETEDSSVVCGGLKESGVVSYVAKDGFLYETEGVGKPIENLNIVKDGKTYSAYTSTEIDSEHYYTIVNNEPVQGLLIPGQWGKANMLSILFSGYKYTISEGYTVGEVNRLSLEIDYFSNSAKGSNYIDIDISYLIAEFEDGFDKNVNYYEHLDKVNFIYEIPESKPKLYILNYIIDREPEIDEKLRVVQMEV